MLKFVVLSFLALGCHAAPYGSYGNSGYSGYSTGYSSGLSSSYGNNYKSVGQGLTLVAQPVATQVQYAQPAYVAVAQPVSTVAVAQPLATANSGLNLLTQRNSEARQEVVQAAVQQLGRTVEYKAVPFQEQPIEAQVVEVEPSDIPLHIHFKTRSSTVSLSQSHTPGVPQETQVTSSQDEPSRLVHEIQKPVIQEVREIVTPYRQVTQEIQPVVEAVHTVVTKAEGQRAQYTANTKYQPTATAALAAPANRYTYAAVAQPVAIAQPVASVQYAQPLASVQYSQPTYVAAVAQPVSLASNQASYGAQNLASLSTEERAY